MKVRLNKTEEKELLEYLEKIGLTFDITFANGVYKCNISFNGVSYDIDFRSKADFNQMLILLHDIINYLMDL